MTYRQYAALDTWRDMKWDMPDRGDFYMMRLIQLFIQSNSKKGTRVDLDKQRLVFNRGRRRDAKQLSDEEVSRAALEGFAAMFGGLDKIRGLPRRYGGTAPDDPDENPFADEPNEND